MSYNVIDIINKAIKIEEQKVFIINKLIKEKQNSPNIILLSKVFEKESQKSINYYKEIKHEINNDELEEIEFRTYDKISFLINEFSSKMFIPDVRTPKEYLQLALRIASDELALFIDIKGRFVNNSNRNYGITYDILSKIISRLEYQVNDITRAM